MKVYGINVILVIAMAMLPGIIYGIWFQTIGRRRAYLKFVEQKLVLKIDEWKREVKRSEVKHGMAQFITNGLIAFDNDSRKLVSWLNTPIRALNHQRPIELLRTSDGLKMVNEALLRIDHPFTDSIFSKN